MRRRVDPLSGFAQSGVVARMAAPEGPEVLFGQISTIYYLSSMWYAYFLLLPISRPVTRAAPVYSRRRPQVLGV